MYFAIIMLEVLIKTNNFALGSIKQKAKLCEELKKIT